MQRIKDTYKTTLCRVLRGFCIQFLAAWLSVFYIVQLCLSSFRIPSILLASLKFQPVLSQHVAIRLFRLFFLSSVYSKVSKYEKREFKYSISLKKTTVYASVTLIQFVTALCKEIVQWPKSLLHSCDNCLLTFFQLFFSQNASKLFKLRFFLF